MVQRHCDVTSEEPTLGLGSSWDVGSQGRLGLHLHREPYSLLEVIWGYFFLGGFCQILAGCVTLFGFVNLLAGFVTYGR